MEFSLKNMGLGLFFLLAVLVLVNVFVIMPSLSLKPEHIPAIQEKAAEEKSVKRPVVLSVDSLAIIKEEGTGEGVIQIGSDNQTLRNPFFYHGENSQQKKVKETVAVKPVAVKPAAVKPAVDKPEPPKPQLSMVIISQGRKQALLGDVFVKEGDYFHGYMVKRIEENEVILSDALGDFSIFLTTGGKESGQDVSPRGLIER
jgi:hypothetical protein